MSSPAMTPRRPRSLAGPVVLIIMGVFLLLRTMGVLHWSLWHVFARFWPLLLILWGVIKLIEYQQAKQEGLRPRGIGAGGVFLIICLIVFGLAATETSRVNCASSSSLRGLRSSRRWASEKMRSMRCSVTLSAAETCWR